VAIVASGIRALAGRPVSTGWCAPQIAKLVDATERGGNYFVEYTVAKEGSPARHLFSVVSLGYNGTYNRLYTLTAQCLEEEVASYRQARAPWRSSCGCWGLLPHAGAAQSAGRLLRGGRVLHCCAAGRVFPTMPCPACCPPPPRLAGVWQRDGLLPAACRAGVIGSRAGRRLPALRWRGGRLGAHPACPRAPHRV
jgi:hypothetical protein